MGMIEISREKRQEGLEEMLEVRMAKNFSILRTHTNQRLRRKKKWTQSYLKWTQSPGETYKPLIEDNIFRR